LGKRIWWYIIAIGVGNFLLSRLSQPIALQLLPVITNSYLGNFIGFLTMAMSIFILREYPSLFQLLGAGIAIFGVTIFFNEPLKNSEFIGILFVLIGIFAVAFTNNIARKLAIVTENKLSNNIVSTVALFIGGIGAVIAGLIFDFPPKVPDLKSWGIIFFSGTVGVALGTTAWNHILRTLRSYEASILGSSSIIWTTLLAVVILGEKLTLNEGMGMATMIVGLVLVQVRRGRVDQLFKPKPKKQPSIEVQMSEKTKPVESDMP
jgi:drug/metabolite transporter (DMT)-like permease